MRVKCSGSINVTRRRHRTRAGCAGLAAFASPAQLEVAKRTIKVPLRDGTRLATDLYVPRGTGQKYPVLLLRTPYNKDVHGLDGRYFASRGYAVAIQDVRGRFASPGIWEPFINEAEDGFDAVEWLAVQEWSTGKVGMFGGSYSAWVQLLAAKLKPPHLATVIPFSLPADPFANSPYENGVKLAIRRGHAGLLAEFPPEEFCLFPHRLLLPARIERPLSLGGYPPFFRMAPNPFS